MSYILNALRRADRERRQDPLATTITAPAAAPETEKPASAAAHWPWILMGIALALSIAGWLMMLLRPTQTQSQPIVIVTPTVPSLAAPENLEALTAEPAEEQVYDSLDDLAVEPPAQDTVTYTAPVTSAIDSAAASLVTPAAPEAETSVETIQLRSADTEFVALKDMPADFRAAFPALQIEVHVYDTDATRRFVRINGQRYLEGDTLDSGPQIDAINEAGIVFRFRGERVLFPSGG